MEAHGVAWSTFNLHAPRLNSGLGAPLKREYASSVLMCADSDDAVLRVMAGSAAASAESPCDPPRPTYGRRTRGEWRDGDAGRRHGV